VDPDYTAKVAEKRARSVFQDTSSESIHKTARRGENASMSRWN
jgi:hypothetical protein